MATKLWTGNALAVPQIQTFSPGPQLPNTTIVATINGKSVSYMSAVGSNDDLVAGLLNAITGILQQAPEFAEIAFLKIPFSPAVPAPNATYLQMQSKTAGVPFTVTISLTQPAKATVTRTTAGKAGVNELQQITISPNAQSGSYFTLTWGGNTTNNIPTPPSAPTSAAGSSGVLTGAYLYAVTFVTSTGETELGVPAASLTLTAQQGSLSSIPLGPSGVTKRKVYRTKAGGSVYFLVGTIADNTTTTYTDNNTDATIGANPGPPATNSVLQGEMEALSGVGVGNVKISGANVAAVSGQNMPTAAIVYDVEFRGTLGNASQALVAGNVANVTILPTITLATTVTGCPPQNEIQTVGWQQVVGVTAPTGTFAVTLNALNVTTAPLLYNASAATVQAALVAAAGPAYAAAFSVALTQSTNAGYLYQITYQGPLALQSLPLATVDVSKIVAATGDTVTGYQTRTQPGTATGRNSTITVTLNNGPTGGTFGLVGTLANGSTITASSVAYNASASTLQGDFPANTVAVSGSAGGPYTIECIGEAASQNVTWTVSSSLSGGGSQAGSPPGSNTTQIAVPSGLTITDPGLSSVGGWANFTNRANYQVTATNANGETTPCAQVTASPISNTSELRLSWTAVPGATGYNIYRSSSNIGSGANTLIGSCPAGADNFWVDFGSVYQSSNIPTWTGTTTGHFTTTVASASASNGVGGLSPATYYYYAVDAAGNRTAEMTAVITALGQVVQFTSTPFGDTCSIWRGTSSTGENVLIAQNVTSGFTDVGVVGPGGSGTSPPGSNTASLSAPVQTNPSTTTGTGSLGAGTYYYEVTATNAAGETTASNEKSATLGATGEITINWNVDSGATGYKIYRGTGAGAENLLVGIVTGGSTTSFIDAGAVPALFTPKELTAGAAAVNEQQLVTLSGATSGAFTLAYEGQQTIPINYNAASATVQTDLQALSSVGSGGFTVSGSAGGPFTVTAAGSLAGQPLPLIAANSTNLVGTSSVSQTITTVQAATGPNFWDNANNWSPTGVPANGDSVYFQNSNVDCLYNLAQSSTTLANLQIDMSFVNGEIGLPSWNGKYYEYRQQYLQIGVSGTILIGSGKGSGPTLVKLDTGANAVTFLINGCGTSLDPTLPAILWKGNRASGATTINISKGSIGIAVYAGETATVDQINQGYVTNVNSDSSIFVGPGTTIGTQWYMTGGQGTLNSSCPTLVMENGTLTILDGIAATAITTLTVVGGTVSDRSTGTITTLTVGTGAVYDRSDDARAKTVTSATITGKSTLRDPNDTITFTNPLSLSDCGLLDVTLDLGTNITLQRNPGNVATAPLESNALVQGRLTLSSTLPITTADQIGASTIYFLPFSGDHVNLYTGSGSTWNTFTIPGAGVALPLSGLTAGTPYDVFLYSSSGTLALEAVAWTNGSTRATAITTQNGVYVKSGTPTHLYLGTFIPTAAGTTEDSLANRYLWNYYNRKYRRMFWNDSTSHSYGTSTWRLWGNQASPQVNFVIGVLEQWIEAMGLVEFSPANTNSLAGIGLNWASGSPTEVLGYTGSTVDQVTSKTVPGMLPALGKNYVAFVEFAATSTTFAFARIDLGLWA